MDSFLGFILIIILVVINGLFVTAEFSLRRFPKTRIKKIVENKKWGSKKLEQIMDNLNLYLTSLQVVITGNTLALGIIGETFFSDIFRNILKRIDEISDNQIRLISVVLGFITILTIYTIFGQIAPKAIAIQKIEFMARITAIPTYWVTKIMSPIVIFFRITTNLILNLFRIKTVQEAYTEVYSEDELKLIIAQSKEEGEIDATEHRMINRIFDFTDTTVKEIVTPRFKIVGFPIETSADEILEKAKETGFSRFPVYGENLDHIKGFIHIKDVFLARNDANFALDGIIREVIIIHEGMRLDVLLKKMQIKRSQVAITIDEYGSVEGLVTIEDLLEEIVGEIDDEFDEESKSLIKKVKGETFLVNARIALDQFNKFLKASFKASDSVTLAGYLLEQLDKLPQEGSSFILEECEFTIEKMDGNRIESIRVVKIKPDTSKKEFVSSGTTE